MMYISKSILSDMPYMYVYFTLNEFILGLFNSYIQVKQLIESIIRSERSDTSILVRFT